MKTHAVLILFFFFSFCCPGLFAQQGPQTKVATRSKVLSQPVPEESKPVAIEKNTLKAEKKEAPVQKQPLPAPKKAIVKPINKNAGSQSK